MKVVGKANRDMMIKTLLQTLFLSLMLTSASYADGITTSIVDDKPCDTPLVSWEVFQTQWVGDNAEWGYTMAQGLWEMRCGSPVVNTYDDETLIGFLFSGHHVPKPQSNILAPILPHSNIPVPIPVPWGGVLLGSALLMFTLIKRKAEI